MFISNLKQRGELTPCHSDGIWSERIFSNGWCTQTCALRASDATSLIPLSFTHVRRLRSLTMTGEPVASLRVGHSIPLLECILRSAVRPSSSHYWQAAGRTVLPRAGRRCAGLGGLDGHFDRACEDDSCESRSRWSTDTHWQKDARRLLP